MLQQDGEDRDSALVRSLNLQLERARSEHQAAELMLNSQWEDRLRQKENEWAVTLQARAELVDREAAELRRLQAEFEQREQLTAAGVIDHETRLQESIERERELSSACEQLAKKLANA